MIVRNLFSRKNTEVVVNGNVFCLHTINVGVLQTSALDSTIFSIHINDLLVSTNNPIYSFSEDSTLQSSHSFNERVSLTELKFNREFPAAVLKGHR